MTLEENVWRTVLTELLTLGVQVNSVGMRPKESTEEWLDFSPLGALRRRSRRGQYHGKPIFQVSCVSKLEEERVDRDTLAPFTLAGRVQDLFEHKDLQVVGESAGTTLSIQEARQRYLPRRNITFEGQGNFSVEQGNVHTVVVTFYATLYA